MSKPLLLIGLDPGFSPSEVLHITTQLREQLPSFFIVVVEGMRYATVLSPAIGMEP